MTMRDLFKIRFPAAFGIALLVAALGWVPCRGQSYLVHVYTENDGLLGSQVTGAVQDDKGRMWFGTRRGVSMYDGHIWQYWTMSTGLLGTSVTALTVDERGTPWFLTDDPGIAVQSIRNGRVISLPFPAPAGEGVEPEFLAVGMSLGKRAVAIGTRNSGVFFHNGEVWRQYLPADGLAGLQIRGLLYENGSFYIGTEGGITVLRGEMLDNRLNDDHPVLKGGVHGLGRKHSGGAGSIWVCGPEWVGALEGERLDIRHPEAALPLTRAADRVHIACDGHGGCFLGNPGLIVHLGAGDAVPVKLGVDNGLAAEGANGLFIDREQNLWISSIRGASKVGSLAFLSYRKIHGLFGDEVSAITEIGPGRLIFGHNGGLSFFSPEGIGVLPFRTPGDLIAAESRVIDIQADSTGTVWIATSGNGLGSFRHGGPVRWMGGEAGIGGAIRTFFIDEKETFWAGTTNALYILEGEKFLPVALPEIPQLYIRKIFQGPDGSIDLATRNGGVMRFDGRTWRIFMHPSRATANDVTAVFTDSLGRTWAGAEAGVFLVQNGVLAEVEDEALKIERPVYLIFEDRAGRLWFGTDYGVVRWEGEGREPHFYTARTGLAGQEINRSAGLIARDGTLWLGTNSGVSCYREKYDVDREEVPPPLVEITRVDVNGRRYPGDEALRMKHSENDFEFHFMAPSFIDEHAVLFRTRLDGFDEEWSEPFRTLDPKIRYTNLSPGAYRFHVMAANALGVWAPPAVSPKIRIARAFWQRAWFVLFVLITVGGMSIGAFSLVSARRYANRLEREVKERTAQLRTSLSEKNVLLKEIHHRVKNNLQVISSLLFLQSQKIRKAEDREVFRDGMSRIRTMALVHETLYGSGNLAAVSVDKYFSAVIDQLKSAYGMGSGGIEIEVHAPNIALTVETAVPCGLIVNELVSNALKHAFHGGREGRVEVRMSLSEPESGMKDPKYQLIVRDDGKGFDDNFNFIRIESLGLRLVYNLAAQLGGSVEVDRDGGTSFTIRF